MFKTERVANISVHRRGAEGAERKKIRVLKSPPDKRLRP